MENILILFWGFIAWFLTGTDDFLVFYSIYYKTKSSANHKLAILGLLSAVLFMLLIVILSNVVVGIIPIIERYTFLGGIIPIYLGLKTILTNESDESMDLTKESYFLLAFLGFFLNSGDDIVFNLSIILGKQIFFQMFFFIGIILGAVFMIWIIVQLHAKVTKDFPKLRGSILIIVGSVLLSAGIISWLVSYI